MPMKKKKTSVYRTNLVSVGIGQGEIETLPYLFNETEYNSGGVITSQSSYTSDGLMVEKMVFEYDEQGRIITQYYYTEPDEPSEVVDYLWNEKGLLIKDVKKYLDGSFDTSSYLYDEQDKLKEKITVDDEGTTDLHEKFFWKDSHLLKHEVNDAEGNIISSEEFKYDDRGNVIEHTHMDEETGENQRTVTTYDEKNHKTSDEIYNDEGDLVESIAYNNDESGKLISSEYDSPQKWSTTEYYYDDHGNNLGHLETDEEGNQLVLVEHTYDNLKNRTESTVFSNGGTLATNQHYRLRYEYDWFNE
jgi:YD repeat-containing protein